MSLFLGVDQKMRVGGEEISFAEILEIKKFRDPFAVFCEETYCEENIMFYEEVTALEKKSSSLSGFDLLSLFCCCLLFSPLLSSFPLSHFPPPFLPPLLFPQTKNLCKKPKEFMGPISATAHHMK